MEFEHTGCFIGNAIGQSHWAWWKFPDESLKARLSAIALRGARALGYDSEDAWYDELRRSEFVGFNPMGARHKRDLKVRWWIRSSVQSMTL